MPVSINPSRRSSSRAFAVRRLRLPAACAILAASIALLAPCCFSQTQPSQAPLSNPQQPATPAGLLAARARMPDANDRLEINQAKAKQASYEAANTERKRQLMEDSALLLKLAAELKAEIDKTSSNMLSLSVVRKADDIERLAHMVQAKMKLTIGAE